MDNDLPAGEQPTNQIKRRPMLTIREIIALCILGLVAFTMIRFSRYFTNDNELIYLIFIVIPLGLLIATDPERKKGDLK